MMRGVWKGYVLVLVAGGLLVLGTLSVLAWGAGRLEASADAAKPRLGGQPGPLREALGFPWEGFPPISTEERNELESLIPVDPPVRISDIRPWAEVPNDPALGAVAARRNAPLLEAFAIIRRIEEHRGSLGNRDPAFKEADAIAEAKKRLKSAENAGPLWLIHYNRGVVYVWEDNHRASREFQNAYAMLEGRLSVAGPSIEVRSAAIHALYGWGASLIDSNDTVVPPEAIDRLRDAAVQVRSLYLRNPQGIGHPAEFFDLRPTGLSTRAVRNDLLAAYLGAPDYIYTGCGGQRMDIEVCETQNYTEPCRYRDERFCETRGRKPLQELYEREREKFTRGMTKESAVWALQNALEIDAENPLSNEPAVAYNVAKLLFDLRQPELAYQYIDPIVSGGNPTNVTNEMVRLAWVTSVLANEKPIGMPQQSGTYEPSERRIAYEKLHPASEKHEPAPFQPLRAEDLSRRNQQISVREKANRLDAWLFIRRYRHLLSEGDFETFIEEHRKLTVMSASTTFLDNWKNAVVVAFLRRAATTRKKAGPVASATIGRFLSRSDLFTDEEMVEAKVDRPYFWWKLRWLYYLVAVPIAAAVVTAYVWLLRLYASTFFSAYQRDRRARARP